MYFYYFLNFLEFSYQNSQKSMKASLFSKKSPFPRIKDRKLVSNKIDIQIIDNSIRTSKYPSFLKFIPQNLYEQFNKKANLYFLV